MLQSRLVYKIQRRIGQQILIGDGGGQNLSGLLNQTGIGAVPPGGDDPDQRSWSPSGAGTTSMASTASRENRNHSAGRKPGATTILTSTNASAQSHTE